MDVPQVKFPNRILIKILEEFWCDLNFWRILMTPSQLLSIGENKWLHNSSKIFFRLEFSEFWSKQVAAFQNRILIKMLKEFQNHLMYLIFATRVGLVYESWRLGDSSRVHDQQFVLLWIFPPNSYWW